VIPDEDCCTLFTPRYPTTGARRGEASVAEADLDVEGLVAQAVDAAMLEEFRFPMVNLAPLEAVHGVSPGHLDES
jgi:thiamine biosynthesis protein ThiI